MLLVCIPQLVNYVTNGSRQARWQEQERFQRRLLCSLEQQGADLLSAGWQQTTSWQHVYSDKVTAWKPSGTRWELVLSKVTTHLKKICVTVWRVTFPNSIDIRQKPSSDTDIIETWANRPLLVLLGWIISTHFLFFSLLWPDKVGKKWVSCSTQWSILAPPLLIFSFGRHKQKTRTISEP